MKNGIPFDGFASVIEMLKYADRSFREKILRNVASLDPALAQRLLEATNTEIEKENRRHSRSELERAQNTYNIRNYGSNH